MGKKIWEFNALTDEEFDDTVDLLAARDRITKKAPLSLFLSRIAVIMDAVNELTGRLNAIITGGSEEKDAELVDIRAGAFEVEYDTAGDAVRDAMRCAKNGSDVAQNALDVATTIGQIQSGYTESQDVSPNTIKDVAVTFDVPFHKKPVVVVGFGSSSLGPGVGSCSCSAMPSTVTQNGFTIRIFNDDTVTRSPVVYWIATAKNN